MSGALPERIVQDVPHARDDDNVLPFIRPAKKDAAVFPGVFFLAFLAASVLMSAIYMKPVLSSMETPALTAVIHGKWSHQFEKSLNDVLPVSEPSRSLWGRVEYALFHQGRKGVVVGADGWLFTSEEFSCPPQAEKNMEENLSFISGMQKTLAAKGTQLAVVLVPAKARVFPQHLGGNAVPACRADVYADIRHFLQVEKIPATDLLPAMQSDNLYLKTDTHWSPLGARVAAMTAARMVQGSLAGLALTSAQFSPVQGAVKTHDGDLLRYVPGVALDKDQYTSVTTEAPAASSAASLLGDDTPAPQVALVGTSYSAMKDWNFAGFLKESLHADVVNMADEGLGPFVVMDKFLKSDEWQKTAPRLVIWEMPERYFLMPHGDAQ